MPILHILLNFATLRIRDDLHKGKSYSLLTFRRNLLPQWQHISTKRWNISIRTHGVISHMVVLFIVTVVRASNLTYVLPLQ
jgi:hypothetical protein